MSSRRRSGFAISAVLIFVIAVTAAGIVTARHGAGSATTTSTTATTVSVPNPYAAEEARNVKAAEAAVNVTLPTAVGSPAPILPARAFTGASARHEVVGFVPSYEISRIGGESLSGFTYLVYSELGINADGAIDKSFNDNGWTSLENGNASALVRAGHSSGDRVLLSVFAESESVIGPLCSGGARTGARLAGEVAPLLSQFGFDGVDLDIEGRNAADRSGYVSFVKAFVETLAATDTSWDMMINTYPTSAEDPSSFYDVKALSPYAGEMFVMGYDMDSTEIPSASAPLMGAVPSEAEALATYVAAGLGPKVILGVPFYGNDFPATGPRRGVAAIGLPYAVTYSAIATSIVVNKHHPLWDPTTETPYTAFQRSGQWRQTWFDDPTSIALKVALAAQFHVAGVGAWEIGMVTGHPQMLSILTGGAAAVKLPLAKQPQ